jgi:Viral coat protein P2 N-terminal domain
MPINAGMRIYEPIFGIEGVSAGGNATAKMPSNRRHILTKIFAAATVGGVGSTDPSAIIDSIVTKIGTKVIRDEKVTDLVKLAALYKLPSEAAQISLYYADPSRADVMDEVLTAWDVFGLPENAFTYQIKLLGGAVAPSLRMTDVYDGNRMQDSAGNVIRQIVKRTYTSTNVGAGIGNINNIPVDWPITAIYMSASAGTIDHVKVTVNDTQVVHDMDRLDWLEILKDYNLDGTQFSYPLLFNVEGQISRRLEGMRNMKIQVTSSAANTVSCWVEQVTPDFV